MLCSIQRSELINTHPITETEKFVDLRTMLIDPYFDYLPTLQLLYSFSISLFKYQIQKVWKRNKNQLKNYL